MVRGTCFYSAASLAGGDCAVVGDPPHQTIDGGLAKVKDDLAGQKHSAAVFALEL